MGDSTDVSWRGDRISRLVLGTAQLGTPYGVANALGQPTRRQATGMVREAWASGIRFFDTAQAYGSSEEVLGLALRELGINDRAKVVSKLSPDLPVRDSGRILEAVRESRQRLGLPRLWAMMLHRPAWLPAWPNGLGEVLCRAKADGLVKHLGVSVSTAEEARNALEHPDIDIIQAPCNAWDQRMREAGISGLAQRLDKLCFIRSVFLQGLLLLSPEAIGRRLRGAHGAAKKWQTLSQRYGMLPAELAVRFALTLGTPLVIGAETSEQVGMNARLSRLPPLAEEECDRIRDELAPLVNVDVYDPSRWPAQASEP
jgi:aryl-alcohol dehydrogenase-like predicted oxidoreductase